MTAFSSANSYRPFRLEIQGRLKFLDPLHVGTGERWSLATDAPILLDESTGAPYLPGTSLRGALRDHLEREAGLLGCGNNDIVSLFGWTPGRGSEENSWSGRLAVFDCRFPATELRDSDAAELPNSVEIRDHVRLNPQWGAADAGAKFDAEVALPREGEGFSFRLIYEGDSERDRELILVGEAVRLLQSGELRVGAKSGWGYGRAKLTGVTCKAYRRSECTGLASFLASRLKTSQPPAPSPQPARSFSFPKPLEDATANVMRPFSKLTFRVRLHFSGPVIVKAPIPPATQGAGDPSKPETYAEQGLSEADHVFLTRRGDNAYYLPGSSLRGVLRSQACRIDHAIAGNATATLFGWTDPITKKGAKGLIAIEDGALLGDPVPVFLDHVAIDRITGAAVNAKKFSQCALASPKFDLSISLQFTSDAADLLAVRLAAFLLRDLMEGRLWAGSGVSRGYGYISSGDLLSVRGDLVNSLAWRPPEKAVSRAGRPGRTILSQSGPFRFDERALEWLWHALDSGIKSQS